MSSLQLRVSILVIFQRIVVALQWRTIPQPYWGYFLLRGAYNSGRGRLESRGTLLR
jgi:hypothetical protein